MAPNTLSPELFSASTSYTCSLPSISNSQRTPSEVSDALSGSSVPSSATALSKKRDFSIPQKWTPSIMAAISKKRLNHEIRNELVRDLVTHMYAYTDQITPAFISRTADMLVTKYPFMADHCESVTGVSIFDMTLSCMRMVLLIEPQPFSTADFVLH